ncbi:putative transcription factor WRKY family [Helianthus debilis subsp. tardiflorus]
MDSACGYDEKTLIHELTQGLQMAERLKVNLHSPETSEFLIQKILSIYDNALFVLQCGNSSGQPPAPALRAASLPESSISFGSPGSDEFEFDQPFWGRKGENILSRKRKGSITWEDEVRICSDNGLEGNTDDGYNWRKYGQKEIQGAKFPRSYYRCSYRNSQKCFATKQVQRKDEDPTRFDIVYKGKHTCNQSASPSPSPSPSPRPPRSPSSLLSPSPPLTPSREKHETLSNLRANLSVNTTDLGGEGDTVPSLFSFPSASSGVHFPNTFDEELFQVYSPTFISPATSEPNIFSEWGSSQSLDLLADVDTDFEFNSLF